MAGWGSLLLGEWKLGGGLTQLGAGTKFAWYRIRKTFSVAIFIEINSPLVTYLRGAQNKSIETKSLVFRGKGWKSYHSGTSSDFLFPKNDIS